jgi:hypothetical protein
MTPSPGDLAEILRIHGLWLASQPGGVRADLYGANLVGADLTGAVLVDANLVRAVLEGANLVGANLVRADLYGASLVDANLTGAVLEGANLVCANLVRADLYGASLRDANLTGAVLEGADLYGTCLDPEAPIPPITDEQLLESGLEPRGDRVYGWRTSTSRYVGSTQYVERPDPYVAPYFSVSPTECHPGIYLASREWLRTNDYGEPLVRCYCLRAELHRAGDKYRCRRLWIVGDDS